MCEDVGVHPASSEADNFITDQAAGLTTTPADAPHMTPTTLPTPTVSPLDETVVQDLESSGFMQFRYTTLKELTNNFSDEPVHMGGNKLGEGAFGAVYLARTSKAARETQVAVKKLNSGNIRVEDQFKTEIEVLSR